VEVCALGVLLVVNVTLCACHWLSRRNDLLNVLFRQISGSAFVYPSQKLNSYGSTCCIHRIATNVNWHCRHNYAQTCAVYCLLFWTSTPISKLNVTKPTLATSLHICCMIVLNCDAKLCTNWLKCIILWVFVLRTALYSDVRLSWHMYLFLLLWFVLIVYFTVCCHLAY